MLTRIAKEADYVPCAEVQGMFRVSWCDYLCPGNPTNDPAEGVKEFNAWQLRVARGDAGGITNDLRLANAVDWCRQHPRHAAAVAIADFVVRTYKEGIAPRLHVQTSDDDAVGHMLDVQFAEDAIEALPASVIMEMQNIARGHI